MGYFAPGCDGMGELEVLLFSGRGGWSANETTTYQWNQPYDFKNRLGHFVRIIFNCRCGGLKHSQAKSSTSYARGSAQAHQETII